MNDLLLYIDQIDQSVADAEINVLESLIASYDKSIMILQESADDADLSTFEIFQEGEKWDKFKEDTKAPVLGNKGESVGKRILMAIPRLIQKLIAVIQRNVKLIRNKRLIRKITYVKNELNGGKLSVKIKGKLDEKLLKKTLNAMKDKEFFEELKKSGKLKTVVNESYVQESKTDRTGDPIRKMASNKTLNDFSLRKDNPLVIDELRAIIADYEEHELLDFFLGVVRHGDIRSTYRYHDFLMYLKRYLNALEHFDSPDDFNNGNVSDEQLNHITKQLRGIKVSAGVDSTDTGYNNFVSSPSSESSKTMIPIDDYISIMKEIDDNIDAIQRKLQHFKFSYAYDNTTSHAARTFLEELSKTIEHMTRNQNDFSNELIKMDRFVSFTQGFWGIICKIIDEDYNYFSYKR